MAEYACIAAVHKLIREYAMPEGVVALDGGTLGLSLLPLVDSADQLDQQWLRAHTRIGVTAGASAPEVLVNALVERLTQLGARSVRALDGVQEKVVFPLPKGLHSVAASVGDSKASETA